MKKKILSLLLVLTMLLLLIPGLLAQATTTINIGDYVQMGRYYDEPILWRCVDIDENGPLMLADRILTIKTFDAAGNHAYADGTPQADYNSYRTKWGGSNLWETSNMRCWLNSTATAGNVTWLDGCPPTADKLSTGSTAYANEKGFLAEDNFTSSEQNAIKSVTQKSFLNEIDAPKLSIGGTVIYTYVSNISTVVQNYDTVYYHNVTDKMFLLDVKQLNKVYQNSATLGINYYIGKPTQKSIDNSDWEGISASSYWYNWIRSPYVASYGSYLVRSVYPDGDVSRGEANSGGGGCRPAFYINLSYEMFISGNGEKGTLYVVEGGNEATPMATETPMSTPTWVPAPMVTPTWIPAPIATETPMATPTWLPAPMVTPTWIPAPIATATPTATPTWIPAPIATATPMGTPTWITAPIATETPIATPISLKSTTINIGDYVQMGSYSGEPILWRCVDIDENGPLMLADRILTIKAFDAGGSHKYLDGTPRADNDSQRNYGSNLWETSNIRCWLNSTATAGNVIWLDGCPPTADKLWNGYNAYANEKGFLAEGNFTASEQNAIKSVTQKSLLNGIDVSKLSIGGTTTFTDNDSISTVVQNYDTAYYQNVTDKMFLLDVKQLNKVYQNSATLGTNYWLGKPTQKSIDNSDYKGMSVTSYWKNLLRSPIADSNYPGFVRSVDSGDYVNNNNANFYGSGARPAFYINLPSVIFTSGNGSESSLYVVAGGTVDKTSLDAAITLTNTKLLSSYGTTSWNAMVAAQIISEEVYADENASLGDVADATSNLTSAINALILLGDVTYSGDINSADALMVLQAATGRRVLTDNQKVAADVNKNGSVNAADALMILQVASGRRTHF